MADGALYRLALGVGHRAAPALYSALWDGQGRQHPRGQDCAINLRPSISQSPATAIIGISVHRVTLLSTAR